jgi:hypothetical protein
VPPNSICLCRWISGSNYESIKQHYQRGLEFIEAHFPTVQHVVLKTPSSVVPVRPSVSNEAIDCWGKDYPGREVADDSLDFRIGGAVKRHAVFDVAKSWNAVHDSFRLSVVDAWFLTDSRPETSFDGRHWSEDENPARNERPLMGEADGFLSFTEI